MKKIILILLLIATSIYAGDVARKGTSGAEEVLIPVGARGIATGGAFIANMTGLESLFYNPAGLDIYPQTEAMFSYVTYLADINISYFAVGTSLGDFGSIAFDLKSFDFGDIPVTTIDFPDGTGETFSPSFMTFGFSYSKVLTDRIAIGTNLKLVTENIGNTNATGFAVDAGVQYRFSSELMIGATVKNIGSNMNFTGDDLNSRSPIPGSVPGSTTGSYGILTESFLIPSSFQLSLTYGIDFNAENNLLLAGAYTVNNQYEDVANFGLEYGFMNNFFVRGGYNYMVENQDESIYGLTFGAGVNYDIGSGVGIVFDYAYRAVTEFANANQIFTIKLNFK
jgi:opacity protein-like surface antigen